MFTIGDKVVYPMHGAGVIDSIESKVILGEERDYYTMKIPVTDMHIMIPVDNSEAIGMRPIVSREILEKALEVLSGEPTSMSTNWNKRYRANQTLLRSGDVFSVAEVVRNLTISDREKGLSTGERKMLLNATRILASEVMLVMEIDPEEAEELIRGSITYTGEGG